MRRGRPTNRPGQTDFADWGIKSSLPVRVSWHVLFIVLTVVAVLPVIWMLTTALKPSAEIFSSGLRLIPANPTLDHFVRLWNEFPIQRILLNTLIVAVGITSAQLLTSLLAAYGFARFRFPFREVLFYICLGTMFIPIQVIMVSNYLLVSDWGLLNTHLGVILPQVANGFGIFLLRQHLRVFPQALLDAARIDGANELTTLFRVVLPVVRPVLAALAVLFFINSWNQYVWPTIVLSDPEAMTLPIWLRQFMSAEAGSSWGLLMSAASLGVLPTLIIYFFAQRLVLGSLAGAGLKG
ncbi:MAG: carbohydrate ABC transporter permease [Trueperaceae bacterium]